MPSKLCKWGNSLGVRLPQFITERAGLVAGDYLYINLVDGEIIIRPVKAREVPRGSPYVIERFEPDGIMKLNRDDHGELSGIAIKLPAGMKAKNYRQNFRRAIAEAMLGHGVIVGEGITEQDVLLVVAQRMEDHDPNIFPLDVAGISVINADGDGNLEKLSA